MAYAVHNPKAEDAGRIDSSGYELNILNIALCHLTVGPNGMQQAACSDELLHTRGAFIIERQIPMQGYSEGCHLCRAECRGVIHGSRGLQNLQGKK